MNSIVLANFFKKAIKLLITITSAVPDPYTFTTHFVLNAVLALLF
ncbi:hypothetical protein [uncultured Aquimarina sp.]|nr:hypothetical protein [uncultured Aquimarina sp.]